MKRPSLRFASHPLDGLWGHATGRGSRLVAFALLSVALLALALAAWRQVHVRAQVADAAARVRPVAVTKVEPPRKPTAAEAARWLAIDRMARQLNTPWSAVFDAIEANVGTEVVLLSIEPDAVQGRMRLELEARQLPPLLAFARRLDQSPAFEHVTLARHELVERNPGAPYRMVVDATMRNPSARAEGRTP